jgi:hypothetical protein
MIAGMSTYTFAHVVISLVGILSGFVVMFGLLAGNRLNGWTELFLVATAATSLTGYGFPFVHLLPSHIVGAISLVVLAIACLARYGRHLSGHWRATYVITAMIALYLNVFVLVVQSFLKIPALHDMAPTQTEGPFKIAQLIVLLVFIALTIFAVRQFRHEVLQTA